MSVCKKLQTARIQLQGMQLKKSGMNKFAGFAYFELADFLPQIQEIFAKVGLSSTINFTTTEATLMIIDTDDPVSQAQFCCPVVIPTMKGCNEIQALGAMLTYIRRYLYVNALEIVEHDAMDAVVGKDEPKSAKAITRDVWDTMPEATQRRLQGVVDSVRAMLTMGGMDDALLILSEISDADEKAALWSRFDSKERSAIKKASKGE